MPRPKRDMTDQYNTPLSPRQEKQYQSWAASIGRDPVKETYNYDLRGAFKAGAKESPNKHMTDKFKKPNHPTFSKESQYHGVDGHEGGQWIPRGGDKYDFKVGRTNLQYRSPAQIKQYFSKVEKGNNPQFTSGATVAPGKRRK